MKVGRTFECALKFLTVLANEIIGSRLTCQIVDPKGTFVGHFSQSFSPDGSCPVVLLVGVGISKIGVYPQLVREIIADVQARSNPLQRSSQSGTTLVQVRKRKTVSGFIAAPRHGKTIVGDGGVFLYIRQPVGIGIVFVKIPPVGIVIDFRGIEKQFEQRGRISNTPRIGGVPDGILNKSNVFVAVQHRNRIGFHFGRELRRKRKTGFASAALFGGNQQHSVGSAGSVNRGGGSVLEDLYTFDVVRVEIEHIRVIFVIGRGKVKRIVDICGIGHSVDYNQGIGIGIQGGRSANPDGAFGSGVASGNDIHPAHSSLQGFLYRSHRQGFYEILHLYALSGKGLLSGSNT